MNTQLLLSLCFLSVLFFLTVDCSNDCSGMNKERNDGNIQENSYTSVSGNISCEAEDFLKGWPTTRFIPAVCMVVIIISLPLNVMAIIIFLFKIKVRTPTMVYMLNLATADVLCVIVLPFNIAYRLSGNHWSLGEGMCRFATAASYCNMYCSILLMTSISVDRFLAIVYPMESLLWRTMKRSWLVCIFIWIVSIAGTVPLLTSELTHYVDQLGIITCYDVLVLENAQNFFIYYFTLYVILFFLLPLFVTTFCYVGIIRSLSSPKNESPFKKSRSILLSVIVLCEFVVCFGPTNIIFLMYYLHMIKKVSDSLYSAYILGVSISSLSCCLDPIIYYYAAPANSNHLYSILSCNKAPASDET